MIIGIPKEIKPQENRVGMTPAGIHALAAAGHTCYVEASAGLGSSFTDEEYEKAGAAILGTAAEVYAVSEFIIKVKEPLPSEYPMLKPGQIMFTYLHLAPVPELTRALMDLEIIGIAYETVQLADRSLPLLSPMSEIAGSMSVQIGAHLLEKPSGGRGVLLGGAVGVEPARVVVVGGGTVGANAVKVACGMGAQVTVLDINHKKLSQLHSLYENKVVTLMSNSYNIEHSVSQADLLVGAVLIPGDKAPRLVTEDMVKTMRPGSVIVDVAIDQGGCIETCDRTTTLENPYYIKHGVLHYSVANMPGAVPRTSTIALTNATLPYALKIAQRGAEKAMRENPALMKGLNVYKGSLTLRAVANAQGFEYTHVDDLF